MKARISLAAALIVTRGWLAVVFAACPSCPNNPNNPCYGTPPQTNCGSSASVALSAISWSPSATNCVGQTITAGVTATISSGTYTVLVTDACCCVTTNGPLSALPTTSNSFTVAGIVSTNGPGLSVSLMSTNPGSGTVTFKLTGVLTNPPCGVSGSPVTKVGSYLFVKITQDKKLWYFAGENPATFTDGAIEVTLKAEGLTTGTYTWDVTAGQDKVNFENDADNITKSNVNTVKVKSTKASVTTNDVSINLTFNGASICSPYMLEVRAPKRLLPTGVSDDGRGFDCNHPGIDGYLSQISYLILNQFDEAVRNAGINETFGAKTDIETNNWVLNIPGSFPAPTGAFADQVCVASSLLRDPDPLPPQTPRTTRKIDLLPQKWFSGSLSNGAGIQVQTDVVNRFIDHGTHENITTP